MKKIGSYELIRQIGEGGFARTYEGRHLLNSEIKACLKQNINLSEEDKALLAREAYLISKVDHYSLPSFRDLYEIDDSLVLAMSFVEGKSLDKIIEKHKALHPEEVSWITQRVLNALHYLHHEGIIHGDIKPPNLIVQPQKHNALLVDFGLSSLKPTSKTMAQGYTTVFAAPEVVDGKPPLPQSDFYSLGLTMIYAWGGDLLTKTNPDYVPKPLQDLVAEFLHPDPLQRPDWSTDLIKRLSDIRFEVFGRRHSG